MNSAMAVEIKNVYDLLRSSKSSLHLHEGSVFGQAGKANPANLPTLQTIEEAQFILLPKKASGKKSESPAAKSAVSKKLPDEPKAPLGAGLESKTGLFQKDFVKYPLVFIVSFGFFYFFLNFGAFSSQIMARFQKQEIQPVTQGKVLGVSTPDYDKWIGGYFYQANNADKLSPNMDYDRDGLTNYQEFLIGTNPAKKDTDTDDYSDGQEILNGYNPLFAGKLTQKQQEIIKDWDLSDINNRISYNARLALVSSNPYENPLSGISAGPNLASSAPAVNYDTGAPGELYIPKLGVRVPLIWSKSPDDFTKDLEDGVIHYPGTSYPGQVGVSYVSGHSSNNIWSKSNYSHVFARLNELAPGDEFFVTVNTTNGQKETLRYVVSNKVIYQPDDQAQFEAAGNQSVVNLSTCWPLGSTAKRIVVSGTLTGM